MQKLIAFTGKAGAGKDTAADSFVANFRYQKQFFALKMKEGIVKMFDLPSDCIFGTKEEKERPIPKLSNVKPVSGRLLLQTIGTDWGRDMIDPNIWIADVANKWNNMKNIPGFTGMVISDLRFDNEAEWVLSQGGVVIDIIDYKDIIAKRDSGVFVDDTGIGHISESGIDPKLISGFVWNKKESPQALHDDILWLLTNIEIDKASTLKLQSRRSDDKQVDIRTLIVDWADQVFPTRTITNALQKLMFHELPEYLMKQDDPLELADLGILLYDIANLAGIDLDAAIREKMAINKARVWAIDGTSGLMSHVKPEKFVDLRQISPSYNVAHGVDE